MRNRKYTYGNVEEFPALTFHYGIPFSELIEMPYVFIKLYVDKLPALLAQQQLSRIEAATFPHAKADAQKKLVRHLERESEKGTPRRKEKAPAFSKSPVVMQRQLGAIGIGVTYLGTDGKPTAAPRHAEAVNDA